MRYGDWKLVRDTPGGKFELFNMQDDPYEKRDLASAMPEKRDEMIKVLTAHMEKAQEVPWRRPSGNK